MFVRAWTAARPWRLAAPEHICLLRCVLIGKLEMDMKRNFAVQTFFLVIFAAIAISGAANAQTIENSLPESISQSLEYCPKGVATSSYVDRWKAK